MQNIPSNIFREYDIRGNADNELTNEIVELTGKAYATWLINHGVKSNIVVGGDARLSTERIKSALINGILKTGFNVIDLGLITTPMLYWSMIDFNVNGGVMITGSHNPAEMNGLKLGFNKSTLWGEKIQEVLEIAKSEKFFESKIHGNLTHADINEKYLNMLVSKFASEIPFKRKIKLVCDSGNGAAGSNARKFFEMLGCECIGLFENPDGNFPNHHPDPQKRKNLQILISHVKKENADLGIAFDGDADRIGVVDDKGEVIFGDRLMALYWQEILKNNPGAVAIIEPKCSMIVQEIIEKFGGNFIYWKSGHSLIKAKMREINALFAGEYSGHMFFADEFFGHDDAFYAAGRLLRILNNSDKKLSEIMLDIPVYPSTEEIRISCPDSEKFEVIERIKNDALKDYECSVIDGVRIIYPDGWGLIRASNTQPVIVLRCEGRTQNALEKIMTDVKKRVLKENLPDFKWTF